MRYLTSLPVIIVIATACAAEEPSPLPTPAEIRGLIDQLVSPNPMPIAGRGPNFKVPEGFDREKQKAVHVARHKLRQMGPIAFPYLIKRWKDERYCTTMSVGINGFCFNATVGDVCRNLVHDQLQPYGTWPITDGDPRGKPHRPSYPDKYLRTAKDARKWYEEHKSKTLYEMQLMVIAWIIDEEAKRPGDYTNAERAAVKKIRSDLIQAGKPLNRGSYNGNDTEL